MNWHAMERWWRIARLLAIPLDDVASAPVLVITVVAVIAEDLAYSQQPAILSAVRNGRVLEWESADESRPPRRGFKSPVTQHQKPHHSYPYWWNTWHWQVQYLPVAIKY